MTARPELPDPDDRAISGSNAGKRTVRAIVDGFAHPDRVLHDLLDVAEADGRLMAPRPGLRAFARELQKALGDH